MFPRLQSLPFRQLCFSICLSIAASIALGAASGAAAQDRRTVVEPHFPLACTVLKAQLSAPGGRLSDSDERRLDTARIQNAIDRCPPGRAVELRASGSRNVFLAGPFELRPGVTLIVDGSAALFASRDPRLYDVTPGSCGIVSEHGHGCKPLILADHAPASGIMGDGVIDGRGGATLLGQNQTWWDLAHIAKVTDKGQSCTRILVVRQSDGFTLYRITLRNSPNFHVSAERTNGFTAWGVKIDTPGTARNTDGIDPSSSTNVSILYSSIRAGDDDVSIKAGPMGPSTHMTIAHDHFYSGHGMSIGSETDGGVSVVRVSDLTIDGADNGIRIKSDRSRGGLVEDISYQDVCMRNVKNPILITPMYTTRSGTLLPVYRSIALHNVHDLTAGNITLEGLDTEHPIQAAFNNVTIDGLTPAAIRASNAEISLGPGLGNLVPTGDGVTVTRLPGSQAASPYDCANRFVPFPENATAPHSASAVPPVDHTLYVAADGTGDYFSVQRAIDAAPATGGTVLISPGVYREVVTIDKPNITLRSADSDATKTEIVFDRSAGTSGGTLHSATVNVHADNFHAENLTVANDWNRTHAQIPVGSQALALLLTGDKAVLRNVRLLGNQDTLYAGSRGCATREGDCTAARQYFSHCYIEGNVDFIFGDAMAVFNDCEIHSTPHDGGFLTAQSRHYPQQQSGYVFNRCRLTADPGIKNGSIYLGRPWRPYATVVYLNTEMGPQINPEGWREWHPGETHSLDTAYFAEYRSTGPGANPSAREPHSHQLTAEEAAQWETTRFFNGWDPEASQP